MLILWIGVNMKNSGKFSGWVGGIDIQGALLSFRMAPPCTNLNCVCGTDVRSSRIVLSVPRVVDGSGNGMMILFCSLFDQPFVFTVVYHIHTVPNPI
jgi:hypothetical protein